MRALLVSVERNISTKGIKQVSAVKGKSALSKEALLIERLAFTYREGDGVVFEVKQTVGLIQPVRVIRTSCNRQLQLDSHR